MAPDAAHVLNTALGTHLDAFGGWFRSLSEQEQQELIWMLNHFRAPHSATVLAQLLQEDFMSVNETERWDRIRYAETLLGKDQESFRLLPNAPLPTREEIEDIEAVRAETDMPYGMIELAIDPDGTWVPGITLGIFHSEIKWSPGLFQQYICGPAFAIGRP